MDQELYQAKVGSIKLKWHLGLRNIFKCWISFHFWLVGPFWTCCAHFHDLASKQSLFLIKFATTLF